MEQLSTSCGKGKRAEQISARIEYQNPVSAQIVYVQRVNHNPPHCCPGRDHKVGMSTKDPSMLQSWTSKVEVGIRCIRKGREVNRRTNARVGCPYPVDRSSMVETVWLQGGGTADACRMKSFIHTWAAANPSRGLKWEERHMYVPVQLSPGTKQRAGQLYESL